MMHDNSPSNDLYPATADSSAPHKDTLAQLATADLQQTWGDTSELDRLFASPTNPEVAAISKDLDRLVELHKQAS